MFFFFSISVLHINFYPRPPRGGRLLTSKDDPEKFQFLSTPSARRATSISRFSLLDFVISIHALREEGDAHRQALHRPAHPISIHALREEGDRYYDGRVRRSEYFYPRPPRGGRPKIVEPLDAPDKFLSTPSARRATMQVSTLSA